MLVSDGRSLLIETLTPEQQADWIHDSRVVIDLLRNQRAVILTNAGRDDEVESMIMVHVRLLRGMKRIAIDGAIRKVHEYPSLCIIFDVRLNYCQWSNIHWL